ncbi:hypothetical protein EVA_18257, partial [gut metagenome]
MEDGTVGLDGREGELEVEGAARGVARGDAVHVDAV